ncbi:MAG: sulfate transporter CysZ [Thermodesulfovibrionales bacterium]
MIIDFSLGISYLFKGFRLIIKSGLKRYFIIPILINFSVFALLTWIGINYYGDLLGWLLPTGDEWWAVAARVVLWIVFAASAMLIMFFTFTIIANFIGSPFNSLLSEKVQEMVTGSKSADKNGGISSFISEIPASLLNELRKIMYYVIFSALILILAFVPVGNIVFPFIWLVFSSWMLVLEYLSYPMENRGMKFRQVRKEAGKKPLMSIGFGLAVMCSTMLPLINFVIMPAAVAGATIMWIDQYREDGVGHQTK